MSDTITEPSGLALASSDPNPGYRWLRENAPVSWSEEANGWLVSRYDDIVAVLKDRQAFQQVDYSAYYEGYDASSPKSLAELDEPEHMPSRRVYTSGGTFSRASLEKRVGPEISRIARETVASLPEDEPFDLVASFAPAFGEMLANCLGLTRPGETEFDWTTTLTGIYPSPERAVHDDEIAFLTAAVESRRREPGGDPVSGFLKANETRMVISDAQMVQNLWAMAFEGGYFTLAEFALVMRALASLPAAEVRSSFSETGAQKTALEELLRFVPIEHALQRVASADTEVDGVGIRKGESVFALLASGNRDEARWGADPEQINLKRVGPPILTFGVGPHRTPGSSIVRLLLGTVIAALYDRFSEMRTVESSEEPVVVQVGGMTSFVYPQRVLMVGAPG